MSSQPENPNTDPQQPAAHRRGRIAGLLAAGLAITGVAIAAHSTAPTPTPEHPHPTGTNPNTPQQLNPGGPNEPLTPDQQRTADDPALPHLRHH